MAINIDANANVNINVSGHEVIDKLEKEVARLNNRLIETQDELSDAMYEADMLRDRLSELEGKDVGILNASLEQFQETARRGTTEIQRMLSAFNVKDAIGNTEFVRDRLLEVEGGVKTVGQALSEIKNEFRPLFEESYNKSGGLLDTQTIQTFLASLDTVLEKVNEISSQVNLMMKDGVPTSGSTGGAYGTTNIIDQIRTSVEGMSEEARAAYQPLTQLVEKVSEFANLDSTRIIGVANAFKGLSGVGDGGYSDKKIANITKLLNTLENADSSKLSALQFNPKGFNELHVRKASLSNLAEYLPQIAAVNAARLDRLSKVDLTNFNNVKVSKASMEAIAQLNDALKELNAVKVAVAAESNGEINIDTLTHSSNPIGAVKRQIASTIAEQEELAYAEWSKIQKEQQRVHDQTIISWNKVGDAAEKEEQRIERATQREIESHYKAEQASEEAAFKELEARKAAEEKKQSEIAKSLADFETKLQKEEADVVASTQKEIEAYYKAEQAREASIERTNEKMFAAKEAEVAKTKDVAFKELEVRQRAEAQIQSEVARGHAEFDAKLRAEEEAVESATQKELDAYLQSEESREAKIEKENEKLFQSHVKTFAQRRELEEQRAHEENEAYQSGLRKAEQAVAKEVELEKQKYQQELDALEKYERAREAKIEKENEKLFQSHVRASQDANLQAKWQSQGLTESNIKSLFGKAEKNQDLFEDFNNLRDRYQEVLRLHKEWKRNGSSTDKSVTKPIEDATRALKMEIEAILELNAEEKKSEATESKRQDLLKRGYKLLQQLVKEEQNWTSAKHGKTSGAYQSIIKYREELELLLREFESGKIAEEDFNSRLGEISKSAQISGQMISANGKATKAWIDRVGGLASKFASWFSLTRVIMAVVGKIREMISNVIEVDSALGQLRIVTQASTSDLNQYAQSIGDVAERTGASITDLIDSTTTYARLGYNLTQSSTLAEYTSMLSKVGAVDVKDAQSAVTAITKAFKEVDADDIESVLDKLVKVGNSFPISTAEISEGLNNAASALAASGNTFEKSVALLTAANTTVNLCRAA